MKRRPNEVNTRTHPAMSFFVFVFFVTLMIVPSSCGGAERHADRVWRQATKRAEQGDLQGAVDALQKTIDQFPETAAAGKAKEQIVVYRGLLAATSAYPSRRARELMVQLARAIERYRIASGRVPNTLDELVPERIPEVPLDPWNGPFAYSATPRGYTLHCLGADGSPGGHGDAADLVVVDGEFAEDRR